MENKKRRTIQDRMNDCEGIKFYYSSNKKDERENDNSFLVSAIDKVIKGVEELESKWDEREMKESDEEDSNA
ncbi:MAG: hypothetical protein BHV81_00395 [Butyricimonas synergistica]|nr:MAG: hypothetical protein BHV81_00395 [Butyricimonas synergistica]